MWLKVTLILLLAGCSSAAPGRLRRSIKDNPYDNAKNLLQMKDASAAIVKQFESAGGELENLAERLEQEVDNVAQLSAYINGTQTEKMSEALAEALNIKDLVNEQRTDLSSLAKTTVHKCERIVKKFEETVAGKRTLDRGMRSILRDMKVLLGFSETKLTQAKEIIGKLREKINMVMASLRVFKGLVKAAKEKDELIRSGATQEATVDIINGITKDIENGVDGYKNARRGDETMSVVSSILGGVSRLTVGIMKAVNRPDVGPKLNSALRSVNSAIFIVETQKKNMAKDIELIIVWKDAVEIVKLEVFGGDLSEKSGDEEQFFFEEVQGIIEDGDTQDIYKSFNDLRDAAQKYLNHVKRVCPECI